MLQLKLGQKLTAAKQTAAETEGTVTGKMRVLVVDWPKLHSMGHHSQEETTLTTARKLLQRKVLEAGSLEPDPGAAWRILEHDHTCTVEAWLAASAAAERAERPMHCQAPREIAASPLRHQYHLDLLDYALRVATAHLAVVA